MTEHDPAEAFKHQKPDKKAGSSAHRDVLLFSFDPNTTDSATFRQLGLSAWMAGNILRYRAKGGVFRTADDFRKVYGLEEEQFAQLRPYIYISDRPQLRPPRKEQNIVVQSTDTLQRVFKYPEGTILDINAADTTELQKVPGIGSATARKIVVYRKQLGGFYHVSQLGDLGEETGKLTAWFRVGESETQRINLNSVSVERLRAHPYFNFYQAKAIVEHRKKKGNLKRFSQLSFYDEFTNEDLERIKHYVRFE